MVLQVPKKCGSLFILTGSLDRACLQAEDINRKNTWRKLQTQRSIACRRAGADPSGFMGYRKQESSGRLSHYRF
jgi:hypothetical protein